MCHTPWNMFLLKIQDIQGFFQKRGPRGPKNDFFEKYAQIWKGL